MFVPGVCDKLVEALLFDRLRLGPKTPMWVNVDLGENCEIVVMPRHTQTHPYINHTCLFESLVVA